MQTRDDLLRGISYYRVHDFVEQMEVVHALESLLRETPEVREQCCCGLLPLKRLTD